MKNIAMLAAAVAVVTVAMAGQAFACGGARHSAAAGGAVPGDGEVAQAVPAPKTFDTPQKAGTKATCPVMGGTFTIGEGTPHSEHQGKHVYFCCPGCKPAFDKDPAKYLKEKV